MKDDGELSAEAKRLFDVAREAYAPNEARVQAVRAALEAKLVAQAATATTAATATKGAMIAKGVAVLGVATAAVVGVTMLGPREAAVAPSAPAVEHAPASAPVVAPTEAPAEAPTVVVPAAAPAPAPAVAPEANAPTEPAAPVSAERPARAPVRATPRAVARPQHATTPTRTEPPAAVLEDSPPSPDAVEDVHDAVQPREAPVVVATDTLAAELELVRAARAALEGGHASRALSLLDAHESRYPRGTLAQERLATRARALCALGRVDEARATARALARVAPDSPHLARLATTCAGEDVR